MLIQMFIFIVFRVHTAVSRHLFLILLIFFLIQVIFFSNRAAQTLSNSSISKFNFDAIAFDFQLLSRRIVCANVWFGVGFIDASEFFGSILILRSLSNFDSFYRSICTSRDFPSSQFNGANLKLSFFDVRITVRSLSFCRRVLFLSITKATTSIHEHVLRLDFVVWQKPFLQQTFCTLPAGCIPTFL